jgi:hypothetical protein
MDYDMMTDEAKISLSREKRGKSRSSEGEAESYRSPMKAMDRMPAGVRFKRNKRGSRKMER